QSTLGATSSTLTGGLNTTLISGLTITSGALPPVGSTFTDTVWVGGSGVLGRLDDFLTGTLGSGGLFQSETDSTTSQLADLTKRIANMNDVLDQQQSALQKKF